MKMDVCFFEIYLKEKNLSMGYVCACAYMTFSRMIWLWYFQNISTRNSINAIFHSYSIVVLFIYLST